jgi:thymidylate synthase (FAD)
MKPQVTLVSHTADPIKSLYLAFRVCYSELTPQQVLDRIESEKITRETMLKFVTERLKTGHASPLEQVHFEFVISGVSRAFSHQFVRHRIGISFEQQSQRYVSYADAYFPRITPKSIASDDENADIYDTLMSNIQWTYDQLVSNGVPPEDARFVLPNATSTNFKVTVNFQQLLHMADLRLCTRAQWEFRKVMALMRAEVMRVIPELGKYMQPKCGEFRLGYCDESQKDWAACPLGRIRPHKDQLFEVWDAVRGNLQDLRVQDWEAINA